jgi:hypothetical protein
MTFIRLRRAISIFGKAGMAVPRKAISQKNSTGQCSGLIFEGCTTKALAEFFPYDKDMVFSNPQRSVRLL